MSSQDAQIANPPFCRTNVRSINYEGLCFGIVRGCSFYRLNVRTMAELSLSIAAQNLSPDCRFVEYFLLFICTKVVKCMQKH